MKIQFAATIKNRHGEDIKERDPRNENLAKTVSLADICCAVLDANFPEDRTDSVKEKVRRWELIQAISAAEKSFAPLEIMPSDIELIEERLGKSSFPASIIGHAHQLLATAALEMAESWQKSKA